MTSIIFILVAFILYFLVYIKSKDLLHPIGIGVFLWISAGALANYEGFYDRSLQVQLSIETNLCILLAGFLFMLPFSFSRKLHPEIFSQQKIIYTKPYLLLFNFILLSTVVAFFVRFNGVLFSPPLLYGATSDLKNSVPDALPGLNYVDLFTPYAALLCFVELKFFYGVSRQRRISLLLYILFAVCSALIYKVSRGEFLVFVLGYVYLLLVSKQRALNVKKIAFLFLLLGVFLYVGALRISDGSRASTQFGAGTLNIILSQIYTYVAMNFQNLNALIESNTEPTYIWGGWKFFLKFFFISGYDLNTVGLADHSVGFFNAKTFIYYFYNDLGLVGVILYSLTIGIILQNIYNNASKNIKYFILNASLMKAIVFMFFGNYFFGELVLIFPYLLIYILVSLCKTESIRM